MGTSNDVLPVTQVAVEPKKLSFLDRLSIQWLKLGFPTQTILLVTVVSLEVNLFILIGETTLSLDSPILFISQASFFFCLFRVIFSHKDFVPNGHNVTDAEKNLSKDSSEKPRLKLSDGLRFAFWIVLFTLTFVFWGANSPFSSPLSDIEISAPLSPPPLISLATFHQRQVVLAEKLFAQNISAYISEPSPNSAYYYNISAADWHLSERPFVFVLTPEPTAEGSTGARVRVVVPSFEETRAKTQLKIAIQSSDVEYVTWQESESPYESLKDLVSPKGEQKSTVLVDENARLLVASEIQAALGTGADVRVSTREIRELRERKTEEELALLKYANEITLHAIRLLQRTIYLGITETKAQAILVKIYESLGFKVKSSLVLFGPNAALPHGSSADRVLQKEDFVLVDTGASYGGYVADVTRTFALSKSKIPKEHLDIWDLVHRAQQSAYDRVTQGVKASEIDLAARQVIANEGLADKFTHRLGHGIGLEGHEAPYLHSGNVNTTILSGNTFSNEPGVYIEGQVGVRLEDCWYMNESGQPVSFTGPAKSPWDI